MILRIINSKPMNNRWRKTFSIGSLCLLLSLPAWAQKDESVYQEFSGYIGADYRYFFEDGLYGGQKNSFPSLVIQPEYLYEWNGGDNRIKFIGFGRFDRDSRRTHFDVRELYYQTVKNNWELSIGFKKVFWGKTEAVHLVDIINQTDFVESFDGEEKLGEAMVQFSYASSIGTFDLFYLPYFRKRVFPGERGRLRTSFIIDNDDVAFESDAEETRPSFAARWSAFTGPFDIGLSYFNGTGREPFFRQTTGGDFQLFYGIIEQIGIDIQATTGPVLWKVESIARKSDFQDMWALAAGIEYSFFDVASTGLDIGIVAEYLHDDRGLLSFSSLDNDLFAGTRFAFNDTQSTEFLIGGVFDLDKSTKLWSIEGSRRLGNSWKAEVEMRLFDDVDQNEFLNFIRRDSFLQFSLNKYF
ncbi:hypothetical protein [Roseivirga sp. 4D4]|uniref:hypothetical protein n=1 Tax=Roseivirga sp. 4D4 TaxID=1889784 RepID=UPI0009F3D785|nr:hypothetical protein [Roseivirga sp. 4D4]